MTDTRFIEDSFPSKEIGEISSKEKDDHHGHINTLHTWWARRPLAASRATAYSSLVAVSNNVEDWQRRRDFIIELSKWKNPGAHQLLKKARIDILSANGGQPPRVLDPFSGGGAIPLEALRLGCDVFANDYNPVAIMTLKATLQFPQNFGIPAEIQKPKTDGMLLEHSELVNPLIESIREWGSWIFSEVKSELADIYPVYEDGASPIGYIWSRTVPCQKPDCNAEIPLLLQLWLSNKAGKKVALYPTITGRNIGFKIVGSGYETWPENFDPAKGTIAKGITTCPVCNTPIDGRKLRRLFDERKDSHRLIAIVTQYPGRKGKYFRLAEESDFESLELASKLFSEKRDRLLFEWGIEPVPDEPISSERPSPNARGASGLTRYGIRSWGELFGTRQSLALLTFVEKVRLAYSLMLEKDMQDDFAQAVTTYLAIVVDKLATFQNALTRWNIGASTFAGKPDQEASLSMKWDYAESNPLSTATGSYALQLKAVLAALSNIEMCPGQVEIINRSATDLPFAKDYFDGVFTDPPYYDNFPYSHLSDFFYVWLKRSIGHIFPDIFATPLSPKSTEIVAYTRPDGGFEAGKKFFEENLKKSFQEIHRVLKPNGVAIVVYAHKSTQGWESLINSLLASGLVITGAWPLNTERKSRQNARETASLSSSIYIVARKMERQPTGFYNDVRQEMRQHLNRKLDRLWQEGISGADFFIAAIGSGIEIFGKYEQVMDFEGNIVRADRMLEEVQTVATDYAVHQILRNGFSGEVGELTRFYVLWRWNYGDSKVQFDEARKLAQSCGVDLNREWKRSASFINQQKESVRLLGPQNRKVEDLNDATELIDTLHHVLLLWEKGKRDTMIDVLSHSAFGRSEAFYRVAQAISQTLPIDNKEKKLLDGFLAGRERVQDDVNSTAIQQKLL